MHIIIYVRSPRLLSTTPSSSSSARSNCLAAHSSHIFFMFIKFSPLIRSPAVMIALEHRRNRAERRNSV